MAKKNTFEKFITEVKKTKAYTTEMDDRERETLVDFLKDRQDDISKNERQEMIKNFNK